MFASYTPDSAKVPMTKKSVCPYEPFGPMYKDRVVPNTPSYNPVYSVNYDRYDSWNAYHLPMDTTPVVYNNPPPTEPDAPPIQTPRIATEEDIGEEIPVPKARRKKVESPLWGNEGLLTFILLLICLYVLIVIASSNWKKF